LTSKTQNEQLSELDDANIMYDVAIIGAGCIGSCIARELSKYELKVIVLERDDDVTQGATKGNSGIIHAGYDDQPNTMRSKFCWTGNQMFPQLDRELKFGYLRNGSLVVARNDDDVKHLQELYARGQRNGVQRLRIVDQTELHQMEPYLADDCVAALYSPDAGTVTPYEFTIALCENAAFNGVQIRTRHEVVGIEHVNGEYHPYFNVHIKRWSYAATSKASNVQIDHAARRVFHEPVKMFDLIEFRLLFPAVVSMVAILMTFDDNEELQRYKFPLMAFMLLVTAVLAYFVWHKVNKYAGNHTGGKLFSQVSGDELKAQGEMVANKQIRARYVVNCAGLFADKIAAMIGDGDAFHIKPRLGEYLLLHKDQGHLAGCTLFPCPDTKIGTKGVLVQTTLWGNLILGPTARDVHLKSTQNDTAEDIMKFLLKKSSELVPSIDASMVIHSFAGARAKSDRGDWIIEQSKVRDSESKLPLQFYHVAGIDSPGLAGSPAIAQYVVQELLAKNGGLKLVENAAFNPYRRPLIFPKQGWRGLKLKKLRKTEAVQLSENDSDWKKSVVCKCEKVTEYEIIDAMTRCGARVDTTQAIRRRTRAGMGHCQADPNNCDCENYVAKLIAIKTQQPLSKVGRRPWPATSLLKQRWMTDKDKQDLKRLT